MGDNLYFSTVSAIDTAIKRQFHSHHYDQHLIGRQHHHGQTHNAVHEREVTRFRRHHAEHEAGYSHGNAHRLRNAHRT